MKKILFGLFTLIFFNSYANAEILKFAQVSDVHYPKTGITGYEGRRFDFAIKNYNIQSVLLKIDCCHWSGYHINPPSYFETLEYINKKYPDDLYGGTCSPIGGLNYRFATLKEAMLYKARKNLKWRNTNA